MTFLVAWTGGREQPSFVSFASREDADNRFDLYLSQSDEGEYVTLMQIDNDGVSTIREEVK